MSIPSDDEAGDSELESVFDYRLHDYALKEYCDTVRNVEIEHGLKETRASNERREIIFYFACASWIGRFLCKIS